MAKRQLWRPRRLLQRLESRRVARLEQLRRQPQAIRRSTARHALAGIVRTPATRGARSAASHAAARGLEAQGSHESLIEKPATENAMLNTQNVPHQHHEYLLYQTFQPEKRQHEMERQSVPKNTVQLPELRSSVK